MVKYDVKFFDDKSLSDNRHENFAINGQIWRWNVAIKHDNITDMKIVNQWSNMTLKNCNQILLHNRHADFAINGKIRRSIF